MAATLLLALALALASLGQAAPARSRRLQGSAGAAIYNGQNAPRGRFRYVVSLRHTNKPKFHVCSGSLIHPQVVLTAAHCVTNVTSGALLPPSESLPLVKLGGYTLYNDPPGTYEMRKAVRVVVNPNFNTKIVPDGVTYDYLDNDVALLLLDRPSTIPTVTLTPYKPKPGNPLANFTSTLVLGWGYKEYDYPPVVLQQLNQKLLPLDICQSQYNELEFSVGNALFLVKYRWSQNKMICAAKNYPANDASICKGDSGGPLILQGARPGKDLQVGIVSFGPPYCTLFQPPLRANGYTNLGALRPWIAQELKRLTGDTLPGVNGAVVNDIKSTQVLGFDGSRAKYTGKPGQWLDIMSSRNFRFTGQLAATPYWGVTALNSMVWKFANRVLVHTDGTRMRVYVNNQPLGSGQSRRIGGGYVRFLPALLTKPRATRRVIIEQPGLGLTIRIDQPFLHPDRYDLAPWLDAWVTLTSAPASPLSGVLGKTLRLGGGVGGAAAAAAAGPLTASFTSVLPSA